MPDAAAFRERPPPVQSVDENQMLPMEPLERQDRAAQALNPTLVEPSPQAGLDLGGQVSSQVLPDT